MQRLRENKRIYTSEPDYDWAKQSLIERRQEDGEPIEDITDEDIWNEAYSLAEMYFDDERMNLNKDLGNDIICIADVGTWRGRRSGYKTIGTNLNDILYSQVDGQSDITVEYDGVDVIASESHHDGCNCYIFREIKPNAPESFKEKIEFKEYVSNEELKKHTRSLRPYVKQIYGW